MILAQPLADSVQRSASRLVQIAGQFNISACPVYAVGNLWMRLTTRRLNLAIDICRDSVIYLEPGVDFTDWSLQAGLGHIGYSIFRNAEPKDAAALYVLSVPILPPGAIVPVVTPAKARSAVRGLTLYCAASALPLDPLTAVDFYHAWVTGIPAEANTRLLVDGEIHRMTAGYTITGLPACTIWGLPDGVAVLEEQIRAVNMLIEAQV